MTVPAEPADISADLEKTLTGTANMQEQNTKLGALAAEIVSLAREKHVYIASAESLTGGLVGDAIVSVSGASTVYKGGIIAYGIDVKETLLEVDSSLLAEKGAVDEEVALQMAAGVRMKCSASIAVATTGVAGPDPDPETGQKPGTVWIAVSSDQAGTAEQFEFTGDRGAVREQTVFAALTMLKQELDVL